jgi:hypothetical protein
LDVILLAKDGLIVGRSDGVGNVTGNVQRRNTVHLDTPRMRTMLPIPDTLSFRAKYQSCNSMSVNVVVPVL